MSLIAHTTSTEKPGSTGAAEAQQDVEALEPVVSRRMMRQIVDGDRWAFDELRRRLVPRVHGLIRVLLPHLKDSDEFVTQVFAEILEAAPSYLEHDDDEPNDWLLAAVQRILLDRTRSERMTSRNPVRPADPLPEPGVPLLLHERYAVGPLLGVGGLARVYRGHDRLLGRDVAIKMFTSSVKDRMGLRVQESEARLLASQQHHGLVALLDAGVVLIDHDSARVYLVMEFVRGGSLRDRLAGGPLSARQVAHLGITLAEALEYAHERGIVHRDIKPANVLLVSSGDDGGRLRAKLADFGVATLLGGEHPDDDEFAVGTAAYLSPEQVSREHVGPASDVYQLGLVLLEALTGHVEFPGSIEVSAFARLERDPDVPASLPLSIARVVRAMVARDPSVRLSLETVITSLRRFSIGDRPTRQGGGDQIAVAARRSDPFNTPPDGAFRGIASLAASICHAPIAIVRIVDEHRERVWSPSDEGSVPVSVAESTSFTVNRKALELTGTGLDLRVLTDPVVAARLGLEFSLAVPLTTTDGHTFGTLCVLDFEARTATVAERTDLTELAAMVLHEMELLRAVRRALRSVD
jgi:eukaryotic-like serine/threonine-protein kinase